MMRITTNTLIPYLSVPTAVNTRGHAKSNLYSQIDKLYRSLILKCVVYYPQMLHDFLTFDQKNMGN